MRPVKSETKSKDDKVDNENSQNSKNWKIIIENN